MEIFLKISAGILITAILCLMLSKRVEEISLLLCIAVCSIVLIATFSYIYPLLAFARKVVHVGNMNSEIVQILLKTVGIGLLAQIVGLICEDVGNKSLAKALQIAATAVILCICVPVLEELLTMLELVLGEV